MALTNLAATPELDPTTPIALHPLVIVNIADHYTRVKMSMADASKKAAHGGRAIGALLGQQSGRRIEIFTSFELMYTAKGESADIDAAFLKKRRDSFLSVFPDYDVIGWYVTGKGISAADVEEIHKKIFVDMSECALALVLDPQPDANAKRLPVYILETRSPQQHQQQQSDAAASKRAAVALTRVSYTVESEESERIGVETAMKVEFADESNASSLEPVAVRLRSAVDMLRERIAVVVGYLDAVERGAVPPDFELLRRIADLVALLPHGESPQLQQALTEDTRDALLVTFLAVVSKGVAQLSHLSADSTFMREGAVTRRGAARQMMMAI